MSTRDDIIKLVIQRADELMDASEAARKRRAWDKEEALERASDEFRRFAKDLRKGAQPKPAPFDPASLDTMTIDQRSVVRVMLLQHPDFGCLDFATIAHDAKLHRQRVRRACRALAKKGATEFHSGLSDSDGGFRGAGYCVSKAARKALEGKTI